MKVIKVKKKYVPHWVVYKPEEVENIIINKYEQGMTKAKIGAMLRDQYGVPSVRDLTGKNIADILKEKSVKEELPEDLMALYRKAVKLHIHLQKEKKDKKSRRSFVILESRINRLINYYKKRHALPTDYKYTINNARLVVKL
ncbi:30S ribosomal protein S15 [Candidatus Parvarchaeota archaeon]|nr:30S ribosomal protein S15 [Candidatus Acidifodinimicrobium mancum]